MTIAGVIIAGGAGRRIGGAKPLRPFRGATLIEAVIARARPQVAQLALNVAPADVSLYRARFDGPLLPDESDARQGPLSGILAGLAWAQSAGDTAWLASFPCDTPFLPLDLVARLHAAARPGRPVVIRTREAVEALCALWPRTGLAPLREGLRAGILKSPRQALAALDAVYLPASDPPPAFFNVNTPEDLAEAERHAAL